MAAQRPTNGVALTHDIPIVDSNGDLVSGITFQAADYNCYQNGVIMSPATLDNTPTELGSTGVYAFTFSAAEMTTDRLTVVVADDAGAAFEPFTIVINPQDALIGLADVQSECEDAIDAKINTTAGAVDTVTTATTATNLTNLPTIPANWITAAGIATDAIGADELAIDVANNAIKADLYFVHGDALGATKPHDTP